MRAVIQRVLSASVEVDGAVVSQIGPGLLCLVGIKDGDGDADAEYICRKILSGRLFANPDSDKAWDQNVQNMGYEVLCVSQFTLYGSLKKNKPDFHYAMGPGDARPFYDAFLERMRKDYREDMVKDGVFGAMMKVSLENDGPVTLTVDSEAR